MALENIIYLNIETLMDFEAQPLKVLDDDAMYELVESIKIVDVLKKYSNVPKTTLKEH